MEFAAAAGHVFRLTISNLCVHPSTFLAIGTIEASVQTAEYGCFRETSAYKQPEEHWNTIVFMTLSHFFFQICYHCIFYLNV